MKTLIQSAVILLIAGAAAQAQTVVIADNYDIPDTGTGFGAGGVNSSIATRLTGTAAGGLQYLQTATTKAASNFSIKNGKLQVAASAGSGRFTFSADGTTPFDFASALGAGTPENPVVYDVTIDMANTLSGGQRFSFGLATVENDVTFWDFGLQLYRTLAADSFYQIGKRIDTLSSGLASDLNASVLTMAAGSYGSELSFRLRFTDAGAQTTGFDSRVELFLGGNLIYDTKTDAALLNGCWRLDGPSRYFIFDQAGTGSTITGAVTYDNLSVTVVPEPSSLALAALGAATLLIRRRR